MIPPFANLLMNTSSAGSSPSPPAVTSLNAPTLPDAPEVKLEVDDSVADVAGPSSSTAATAPLNGLDLSSLLKGTPGLQALLSSGSLGDNPALMITKLFGSAKQASKVAGASGAKREVTPPTDSTKKARLKVFSNGFFMTFDKVSSCQKKHFWRCEYKNTCKARMHTDVNCDTIVTYIHEHNHSPPTKEEVRLYGIDPDNFQRNRVYVVGNIADPNQRRKIRKQVADQEAAAKRLEQQQQEQRQKQQTALTMAAAQAAYARAIANGHIASSAVPPSSPLLQAASSSAGPAPPNPHAMLLAQLPFLKQEMPMNGLPVAAQQSPKHVSPNLTASIPPLLIPKEEPYVARQPPVKRKAEPTPDDHELKRDPMFEPTFEIARKLRKLWKGEPSRYPRTNTNPSQHFEFYLSKNDGSEEHLYVPMRIEQRDETHLKEALQEFTGQKCIGMLLFGISPKISVMFNQPMLSGWDNNQFFLLDISNPSRWRLMYVDDQAV